MKSQKKQEWVTEGYQMVADSGFNNLNIKSIAFTIKKSKSSFYHCFGDKAIFEAELLNYHLDRVEAFSQEVSKCKSIRPDYIKLLLAYKSDFLFHKQLRLNRDKPNHKKCFEKAFGIYSIAALDLWVDFFGLTQNRFFVQTFLHFFSENFLLQISSENYTYNWLNNYVEELYNMLKQLKSSQA